MARNAFGASSVLPVDDDRYPLVVGELLRRACSRAWLAMFFVDPYPYDDKTGEVRGLIRELVRAQRRSVDVRVIVDRARGTAPITAANQLTYMLLRTGAVPCRYYSGSRRSMHSKYLIVDNDTALIGSHNFSGGAFAKHRESSLLVASPGLVGDVSARFLRTWLASEKT